MINRKKASKDAQWARRISSGVQARDRYKGEWARNRTLLMGYYGRSKQGKVVSKVGWAAYQTMVGSIFAQNPRPIVREKNPLLTNTAKELTQISERGLDEMNLRDHTHACIQDVFWAGFSILMQRLDQDVIEGTPSNQQYSCMRVHPLAVIPDPKGVMPDMSDSLWASIETYPTIKQLKEDPDFKVNKEILDAIQKLSGPPQGMSMRENRAAANGWSNQGAPDEDDEFAVGRVQEVYDKANKSVLYIPTGTDYVIGEKDWTVEPYFNKNLLYPWTVMYFNVNPDEFWPIPEMSMIADEIEQLSVLDRKILTNAVTKFDAFVVRGEALEKGAVANLKESSGPKVLMVRESNIGDPKTFNVNNIVGRIPEISVQQDVMAVAQFKKNQIHETVGAGDFSSAGMRSTRSATEAAALSDFLRQRMTTRTENIDVFFKKVVRMFVLFLQQTATEKRFAKITDTQGIQAWKEFDKDDIKGDFDFEIIAGSSMPKNTDSTRERNLAFFQQIAPQVLQSGGNIQPLIEWLAPHFDIPQHLLDMTFANHKQALQQLALAFAAAHDGVKIDGAKLMELIAATVNTGLNAQELQQIQGMAMQAAQQQANQPQGQGGGAPPPAQPGGMPGTNTGASASTM